MTQELRGTITRTVYHNQENGWSVLTVQAEGEQKPVTCVGNLLEESPEGLCYEFSGDWANDPRFGRQFKFAAAKGVRPTTVDGLRRYLTHAINGLGEVGVNSMLEAYGEKITEVLDGGNVSALQKVKGIGKVLSESIVQQWQANEQYRESSVQLMSLGLSASLAIRIIKHYESKGIIAWDVIQANPYTLTQVWGCGFKTADGIARKIGFSLTDPRRIKAACVYVLQQARDGAGHCYLSQGELQTKVSDVCELNAGYIAELLDKEQETEHWRDVMTLDFEGTDDLTGPRYYLPSLYRFECSCAEKIAWLSNPADKSLCTATLSHEELQHRFESEVGYRLTDEQLEAVFGAMQGRSLSIITGGPGVGKTSIVRAVLILAEQSGMEVGLCAPTGRAAKRMEELTRHEAKTIHRTLRWDHGAGKFNHTAENPLRVDMLIVDEVSMVDLPLMHALTDALEPGRTRLLLVGDKDQLPSVGPGNVLHDLISSGVADVFHLQKIMRQAEKSGIIVDAHRINKGTTPTLDWGDCTFVDAAEYEQVQDVVRSLVVNSDKEVQVLSPQKNGEIGTKALNVMLQEAVNPPVRGKPELKTGSAQYQRIFRVGDRVMQIKNDYERMVFNGDIGEVLEVNLKNREVLLKFSEVTSLYGSKDLNEVEHAWAITGHKSQGGEYPRVVVICHSAHFIMLARNILYTMLTRAQQEVMVVGNWKAVEQCVHNNKPSCRNTRLRQRLEGACDAGGY